MSLVKFDLHSPFAGFELLAYMLWPKDADARADYLVTTAAQVMHRVEEKLPPTLIAAISDLFGRHAIDLPSSNLIEGAWTFPDIARELNQEVEQKLLRPAGGYGKLAVAPGVKTIFQSAQDSGRKYGAACGEILIYVTALATQHPTIHASLNRATYVMVQSARRGSRKIPAERDRKTMWTEWREVAPLWAAMALIETREKTLGAPARSLHDLSMREEILAASAWLIDFSRGFTSRGSRTALLPQDEGLTFDCGIPAQKPDIPPLTNEQIHWASAYKAPQAAQ